MNTVLFVNATIGFSENLFLVCDLRSNPLNTISTMNLVKFDLLFILAFIPSSSYVLKETLQNFSTFCYFSFGGEGGQKGIKGIKFLIRHQHSDISPKHKLNQNLIQIKISLKILNNTKSRIIFDKYFILM